MRTPSTTLVVDAAILVAAARGRNSGPMILVAGAAVRVTTDRAVHEARHRIMLGMRRPELVEILDALVTQMTVVPVAALAPYIYDGETVLRDAVAARNGSTRDAHVLALAWSAEADIWTLDRDFAGTGVAAWSTPNLLRGLLEPARAV